MEDIRNLFDRGDSGAEPEARNAERDVPKEEEADIEKYIPGGDDMEFVQHKPQRGVKLQPLDEIDGFQVRPGYYNRDGATAAQNGVSFTGGHEMYAAAVPAPGDGAFRQAGISGILLYREHVLDAGVRAQYRGVRIRFPAGRPLR